MRFSKKTLLFVPFLFILFFLNENTFCADGNGRTKLNEGIQAVYNFEFEKADQIFSAILKKNPDDLLANHFSATLSFWKYFGSNKKKYLDDFIRQSDITIGKAEQNLSTKPQNKETLYVLGASYGYRAMAFGKAEKFLDMIWASKKSNSYLEDLLEIDKNYYDAYMGIGLIKFALSQVPSGFKWALSMIGFKGDAESGFSYLKTAAEKGTYAKVEAAYYLSQLYAEYYFDYDLAKSYLNKLHRQFPENLLFTYSLAVIEVKGRDLSTAANLLKQLVKEQQSEFEQLLAYSKFLLGDVYFYKNQFEQAKEFYKQFLSSSQEKNYTGIANYRLALCYEFTNDRDSSKKLFQAAQNGNEVLDDDYYAKQKGELYQKRTVSDVEGSLIFCTNLLEQKNYDDVIDSMTVLLARNATLPQKDQMYLLVSEASFYQGKYDSALVFAKKSLGLQYHSESWTKPFACYYASMASLKKNDKATAESYFEKAGSYDNFFYENKLKSMLKNLSRLINN